MTALNHRASVLAVQAGLDCATDVTGFGLLGHPHKLAHASQVTAALDATAGPYLDDARASLRAGYVSGGTRRNLDRVRPHLSTDTASEEQLLLLAAAQTSGGLLIAGEIPSYPIIGELVPTAGAGTTITIK